MLNSIFRWSSFGLAILALAASVALLIGDTRMQASTDSWKSMASASPLLLGGLAFLLVQSLAQPGGIELIKNLILAGAFLLWGAIQLMPPTPIAKYLGNVVIVLYVVDLAWGTLVVVNSSRRSQNRQS
jgi:hypothetical protein